MKFIARLILQFFANILGILAADYFIEGFSFNGDLKSLVIAAVVLSIANLFLKPILRLALGPLILLTFGLFTIVINMFLLYLVTLVVPAFQIVLGWPFFYASLIIGFINFLILFSARFLKK